jgi:nucleoside-diphosphate-sugar epimerase
MPSVRPRRSSRIAFHPLPANDPRKRKPEISEAIAQLHWHPKTTLEEGLIKTIEYFFDSVLRVGATAHPRVVAA